MQASASIWSAQCGPPASNSAAGSTSSPCSVRSAKATPISPKLHPLPSREGGGGRGWTSQAQAPGPLWKLGRRRGWLIAIQPALTAAAALLALSDPARFPFLSLALAALVAFLSASQDIVVDAWRIETYPSDRQGAAMAAYIWGYRVALLIATTG